MRSGSGTERGTERGTKQGQVIGTSDGGGDNHGSKNQLKVGKTNAGGPSLGIAVVACDGAYMGVTTNVPQQLALGTPLSRRAAPAVALISTKRPTVTKRVQEPKVIYSSFPSCSALAAWSRACTRGPTRPSLSSTASPTSPPHLMLSHTANLLERMASGYLKCMYNDTAQRAGLPMGTLPRSK